MRGINPLDILQSRDIQEEGVGARPTRAYTKVLIAGVGEHRRKIDELISTYAQGWDMDRMPRVDRNILRLAIYEILWREEVPDAVAIDEALGLARSLSTDESASYVHGVLGRISSIKESISI